MSQINIKGAASPFTRNLLMVMLVVASLYFARSFFIPLFIGGVLATLFFPVCRWLEHKRIPKLMASLICLSIVLLIIAGIATLIGWQISALNNDAELVKQRITDMLSVFQQYIYDRLGISQEQQLQILRKQKNMVSSAITAIAGSVVLIITDGALALVYTCLLLYYRNHIRKFILKLTPDRQKQAMQEAVSKAVLVSQQYLTGLAKMIACLWIMYAIGFSIVGVKNALFFAILCGILEIVPFIGNITGTLLTLLASSVQGADNAMLFGILITYGTVQFIQGWVLEPAIVGSQVKLNPLFTIIALVIGELIWGIPGIILAIPLTAILKIMCDHVEQLHSYGFLLGETSGHRQTAKTWFSQLASIFNRARNQKKA